MQGNSWLYIKKLQTPDTGEKSLNDLQVDVKMIQNETPLDNSSSVPTKLASPLTTVLQMADSQRH